MPNTLPAPTIAASLALNVGVKVILIPICYKTISAHITTKAIEQQTLTAEKPINFLLFFTRSAGI